VLFDPLDRQLDLLVVLQIWRDLFVGVLLAFDVIRDDDVPGRGGFSGTRMLIQWW
jgi:hypothetical protein